MVVSDIKYVGFLLPLSAGARPTAPHGRARGHRGKLGQTMADISALVGELSGITDQKLKLERYMAVLQDYVSQAAIPQLQAFVQHVVSEDVQLAVSRPVVLELAKSMSSLALEQRKEIGLFTLDKVGLRVVSFEEQVSVIREELATIYEKEEKWSEAAKMLAGIPLDSGIRVLDDNYKVQKYIKIAQLFLEDDEPVSAEGSINRASLLITEETEPSLRLLHKARSPLPLRPVPSPPSRRRPPPCCPAPALASPTRLPPSTPRLCVQGVLRAHPRLEAQVPRGGHALLPALPAAGQVLRRAHRLGGGAHAGAPAGGHLRDTRARGPAALAPAGHAVQGRALLAPAEPRRARAHVHGAAAAQGEGYGVGGTG